MILHQGLHFFLSAFVPLGDVHVQRVVTARLAVSPLSPLFESTNQVGAGLWHNMVNCKNTNNSAWF